MQSSNRPRATRDGTAERCHGSDDAVGQAHSPALRPAHQGRKRRWYALEEGSAYGSSMENCRSHEDDGGTSYPADDGESEDVARPSAALTATLMPHIRARTACPSIATRAAKRRKVSHDGVPTPVLVQDPKVLLSEEQRTVAVRELPELCPRPQLYTDQQESVRVVRFLKQARKSLREEGGGTHKTNGHIEVDPAALEAAW